MRCVIAGGGTGGHLFPGIAVAEAFTEREEGNEVLFIGTERGIEVRVLADGKFPLKTIRAMPFKGRPLSRKIRALGSIPSAVSEALSVLKDFRPQLVLGVGGYASGPVLLAAYLLGIKRAIHEQNMVPGMTNRILKWFSQRIFVSFEEARRYFPEKKTRVTGNPIRKEFFLCSRKQPKGDRFTVLVFGGSAGAHRINEAVGEALDFASERHIFSPVHSSNRQTKTSNSFREGIGRRGLMPWSNRSSRIWSPSIRPLILSCAGQGRARLRSSRFAEKGRSSSLIPLPPISTSSSMPRGSSVSGLPG